MTEHVASGAAGPIEVYSLTEEDLRIAIQAGIADFKAVPVFGLFFAAFYVAGGLALWFGLVFSGQPAWFIAIAAGFPLFAPFAAVGLYEVSRRREAGEPLSWGPILGALKGRGDGQLALMAVGVLIAFGFWIILARGIFAIFLGQSGIGFESMGTLLSWSGILMLLVGTAIGGLIALGLFSITVISLPMLLDRDVDFVTAMIASAQTVQANPRTMLRWAALIAGLLFAAMIPLFLGLFVVLPILGHATWHLYRRAVAH
jgi:uncharacterized membrane protein